MLASTSGRALGAFSSKFKSLNSDGFNAFSKMCYM